MATPIDLRSDTVTQPSPPMLQAMTTAALGDDVLGDDPTVMALEERCAAIAGTAGALFVPSGTMANLIAIEVSTRRGDEVLLHEDAHPFHYETAGAAGIAGVQLHRLGGPGGVMDPADVVAAIRDDAPHYPHSALLCVEDTHNRSGGRVQPLDNTAALIAAARAHGLAAHLDGARLFNASVASGVSVRDRAAGFDTVSFCFSKGLGCPVGSILCGDMPRMVRARRIRKMLGGAMRQSGLLAAAALYALEHHVERLADDHRRAAGIAEGLQQLGFDVASPQTNIVVVGVPEAQGFVEGLAAHGVRCFPVSPTGLRLVVHLGIDDDDVATTIEAFRRVRG